MEDNLPIPESFDRALADVKAGRTVPLDVALASSEMRNIAEKLVRVLLRIEGLHGLQFSTETQERVNAAITAWREANGR